ncbi:MAG: cobyrinic acid a,c-diamide synthase [Hyphomicrobiales bacterium]|nr:MAG: cobyrinic acid a,c-diamide synthase [Hyphomicrobiales bacterium]
MGKGLVIAATHSGAGKTLITMALLRCFKRQGFNMAAAKTGPDYIDPAFHAKAIDGICYNYDLWAMNDASLLAIETQLGAADMTIVEGVLGLFDGAISKTNKHANRGNGSTADVAARLNLPVILLVDAGAMGQSVAALVHGFASFRPDINVAAIIFNNVGSERHKKILIDAVAPLGITVIGCLPRHNDLRLPNRHLGLVQANEMADFETFIEKAADYISKHLDLNLLASKFLSLQAKTQMSEDSVKTSRLNPLGQNIAIAKDAAFTFIYPHILAQWRDQGANLSFFSPLADQLPAADIDAVFLPGGYPELFASELASKDNLRHSLQNLAANKAIIYGECGGYMAMGKGLVDSQGVRHKMFDLLDLVTSFEQPKRHLGYRHLSHQSALPWAANLRGHEFHYTHALKANGQALFEATDAQGVSHADMGLQDGNIMGSYAHVIDVRPND